MGYFGQNMELTPNQLHDEFYIHIMLLLCLLADTVVKVPVYENPPPPQNLYARIPQFPINLWDSNKTTLMYGKFTGCMSTKRK